MSEVSKQNLIESQTDFHGYKVYIVAMEGTMSAIGLGLCFLPGFQLFRA